MTVLRFVLLGLQVKLLSSDTQTFEVDAEVAKQSVTIQNTIEGVGAALGREQWPGSRA